MPKANAVAEWFVRTVHAECVDWLLILNRRHLERVLRVYVSTTTPSARTARSPCARQTLPTLTQEWPWARSAVATSSAASFMSTTEPPREARPE